MSGRLDGKVAVITGAGSGIGRASAELFAREGAKVVCVDVSGEQEETAAGIGAAAVPVHADVRVAADVRDAVATAERRFGRLDVLFNNAGIGGPKRPITEQSEEDYARVLDVNLKSVFLGMKFGIAAMLRTGGGSVINTASAAGLVGWRKNALYGASKGGVVQMTKATALDFAEQGVRVNALCPGMTWTGLVPGAADAPLPPADASAPPQPMRRWGLPTELAAAALFLACDESSFVTGVALPVDGGYVCG
ncbi:SDR family NAD(P)-dependent oxidoreductase [Actinomadura sp. WMMB 499]|uniref:SDR family NAD(P)-dependent oxidoreductase n=1 Tax=Actinomadura sp. WMMB 499 TaxID=1219491 RepID=UPI001249231E|nr:SDR family oxidoreductase [Actinomadura sp. WMMB 499]QFG22262.1 SDR family oxidoreductase [Actinomadura sp. WMMB 499]